MQLINRILKLEEKQQQATATCYPIDYFYGRNVEPVPLIRNLSLAAFYTSIPTRLVNGVSNVKC